MSFNCGVNPRASMIFSFDEESVLHLTVIGERNLKDVKRVMIVQDQILTISY